MPKTMPKATADEAAEKASAVVTSETEKMSLSPSAEDMETDGNSACVVPPEKVEKAIQTSEVTSLCHDLIEVGSKIYIFAVLFVFIGESSRSSKSITIRQNFSDLYSVH